LGSIGGKFSEKGLTRRVQEKWKKENRKGQREIEERRRE
jgi:hypothetical protein